MFSTEQRTRAIETFIKYDHCYADTIAELGYPTRATLRSWWKEYEATGEVPAGVYEREPHLDLWPVHPAMSALAVSFECPPVMRM